MINARPIRFVLFCALLFGFLAACLPILAAPARLARHPRRHKISSRSRYGVSTFADSTEGDVTSFDDPIVRQAAIRGLGRYNGSVVAIDPNSGRILTIVNQKLAFSAGFKPCSTIKPVIAVAALEEGIVTSDTKIRVTQRKSLSMTEAMAHSNN